MTLEEIARWLYPLTAVACKSRAKVLGLRRGNRRPWTADEKAHMRKWYLKKPAVEIAADLGRPRHQIFQAANRFGLAQNLGPLEKRFGAKFDAFVRQKHALGWSDDEISQAWGCERHTVGDHRKKLRLPHNGFSERVIDKIRAGVQRQAERHGVKNIGELRGKVLLERAVAYGWPHGIRWRATQILNLLWERGPMTRVQIADALALGNGGDRRRSLRVRLNKAFMSNEPGEGGSYFANLLRRGLIVSFKKAVRPGGRGKNVNLYMIAPGVERGPIDPQLLKGGEGDQHAKGKPTEGLGGTRGVDGEDARRAVRRRHGSGHDGDHEEAGREGEERRRRRHQTDHGPGRRKIADQAGVERLRGAAGQRPDRRTAGVDTKGSAAGRSGSSGRIVVPSGRRRRRRKRSTAAA